MKRAALMTAALAPLLIASGLASAANLPGSFPGVTIDAKLIGGQEYEPLYARIAEWEKLTGGKVNIISKKNHFELDKEFKSDLAANSIKWCVGSNHTSFAPQYPNLYTDLTKLIPSRRFTISRAIIPTTRRRRRSRTNTATTSRRPRPFSR